MCQAFCPASATKVYYGSNIDDATASNGERYADSENAFAYRKALRADCTCNGRDPSGLAPVDLTLDTSLRPGDVIATTDGLVAFTGVRLGASQTADFTPVASYPGLTAEVRARLGEMKVAPVTAEMVSEAPAAGDARRRRGAGLGGAEDGRTEGEAGRSELGDGRQRSSLRGAQAHGESISPLAAMTDCFTSLRNDEDSHRPTITPITFGAARYFSSIAARAAARFSGVRRPRFSARIIQQ